MNIIEAKHLFKSFKVGNSQLPVLKDLNLEIKKGEFISILGPSGSGKTTLLNILGTIEKPTSGELFLFSNKITNLNSNKISSLRQTKIAFIFQFFNLIPHLNVLDNILIASSIANKNSKDKAITILKELGLEAFLDFYPSQLSGGMQQRVAIARSLINDPKIIFADEPIGNLDYQNGLQIMEILKKLNEENKITIVMVTHNEETTKYTKRIIKMKDGQIKDDYQVL